MHQPRHKYTYLAFLVIPLLFVPVFVQAFSFQEVIWKMIISFFGFFVFLFGSLLDYVLAEFVINFSKSFLDDGVGYQVEIAWTSVRDIFNMTFIFGLVYIGFKMILNSDDSNTRKLLVNLILAALLVNFSLFFTKIIVEVSNTVASEIAMSGFAISTETGLPSVSASFMNMTGLATVYNIQGAATSAGWGYIFGTAILLIVSMFVFAAGAFMLLIRYAALMLYMIFSPIMFLGWVFPQLQQYTDKYWKGFLGSAFFAPVYILLVYLAITVATSFYTASATLGEAQLGEAFIPGAGAAQSFSATIPPFVLSIVLMLAAVVVSSKMSADGASGAMKLGNKAVDWGQRKVKNGVNRTGRAAGKAAAYYPAKGARGISAFAGNKMEAQINKMQRKGGLAGRVAKSKLMDVGMRSTATSLRDAKMGLGASSKEAGLNEAKRQRAMTQREDEFNKLEVLKTGKQAKDDNNYDRSTHIRDPRNNTVVPLGSLVGADLTAAQNAQDDRDKDIQKAATIQSKLTMKQLEELAENDQDLVLDAIGGLNDSTFEKLIESPSFDSTQVASMVAERQNTIKNVIEKSGVVLSENIQNMSIKQIETMGAEFLEDNAALFSKNQKEGLSKSTVFSEPQKQSAFAKIKPDQVAKSRNAATQKEVFNHNTKGDPGNYTKARKPSDIANLPFDAFMDASGSPDAYAISQINGAVLEEIINQKTMSPSERRLLRTAIVRSGTRDAKLHLAGTGKKDWY